jgi:hypothetical protein
MIGQTGRDLLRAVVDAPKGYAQLGKALATGNARGLVKGYAQQMGEDLKHPLRHPGYTLLDAMMVGSLGGATALRGPAALARVRGAPRELRLAARDLRQDAR